ncbi:hypothetical protein BDN72DRAFT_674558 [Pluteus cervinus]|uniref:Uncharacterized protein n=1 Tax=Pluteus cervinus TaxID=181527 RepID=A0ACD3AS47_9AGAR|nr:hypothetical protein BDN72DRAFT_674558 [Pluteus cervinus]
MAYSYSKLNNPLAGNAEEVVARRQSIDDELQVLQKRMHDLRVERNSLCPIHCLSIELLGRIFLYLKGPGKGAGWEHVARVSRYWRDVALGCSPLWNVIDFSSKKDIELWLNRSKGTQLSVYAARVFPSDMPILASLLEDRLFRICRLSLGIWNGSPDFPQLISKLVTIPATSLEYLRLEDPRTDRTLETDPFYLIPGELFSSVAPRLRELEISGCNLDSQSALFQNLTHLTLHDCYPTLPFRGFLEILAKTPHLESLSVDDGFSPPSTDQGWELVDGRPSVFRTISLPSLKFLSVSCCRELTPQALSLPAHLALKSNTCVELSGFQDVFPFHSVPQVDALIREKSPSAPIDSITLFLSRSSFRLAVRSRSESDENGALLLKVCLTSRGDNIDEHHPSYWAASLLPLPLSNLHSFHTNIAIPHIVWFAVFGHLRSLEVIGLTGDAGPTFVEALMGSCSSEGNEIIADVPFFPGLQTIEFVEMNFCALSLRSLRGSLAWRMRRTKAFHGIKMRWCVGMTASIVKAFKKQGIDVEWDRREDKDRDNS